MLQIFNAIRREHNAHHSEILWTTNWFNLSLYAVFDVKPTTLLSWLTNPPFVRKWLPPLTDEKSCASTKPSSSEASQCLAAKNICDVCWHFLMILAKHEPQGLKKHGPNFQQNQMRCVYVRSSYVRYYSLAFLFHSVQMILACDGLTLTFLWGTLAMSGLNYVVPNTSITQQRQC